MNEPNAENIYVVGFPKSGNTWLVRMVAKILSYSVNREPMGEGGVDLAHLANFEADLVSDSIVYKIHFLPKDFLLKVDPSPKKIIYISRDPRDVFVSSFFYFCEPGLQEEARIIKLSRFLKKPSHLIKSIKARKKINNFLKNFIKMGIPGSSFGTVFEHKKKWKEFLNRNNEIAYSFTSYEQLLNDTSNEIRRVLMELGFENLNSNKIADVVSEESFDSLKEKSKSFHQLDNTFSKDYYVNFFRSGKAGDWKNYLTRRQANIIQTEANI